MADQCSAAVLDVGGWRQMAHAPTQCWRATDRRPLNRRRAWRKFVAYQKDRHTRQRPARNELTYFFLRVVEATDAENVLAIRRIQCRGT
eukprot:9180250-Lingulodinium_polyedra.AAC.1